MNKKYLIVVVGPTAIGKTALGIDLAKHFHTEIISADSRQFFKEMRIGTAVPSKEELTAAPHHFIQHKSLEETYSVGDFEREALEKLRVLYEKYDTVVMVGGSGLYVDAVVRGLDHFPEVDPDIRIKLNKKLADYGIESLRQELKELDANYYSQVDLDNPHRIIRALEICLGTGKAYSSYTKGIPSENRFFEPVFIGLTAERPLVYDRINQRVDLMMNAGLLEEAKALYPKKHLNGLNTVGYKELFHHLEGNWNLTTAIEEIKKNTRRFAKRQLTWFKKNEQIHWFDYQTPVKKILSFAEEKINQY